MHVSCEPVFINNTNSDIFAITDAHDNVRCKEVTKRHNRLLSPELKN